LAIPDTSVLKTRFLLLDYVIAVSSFDFRQAVRRDGKTFIFFNRLSVGDIWSKEVLGK
jgi:hypothetical protein